MMNFVNIQKIVIKMSLRDRCLLASKQPIQGFLMVFFVMMGVYSFSSFAKAETTSLQAMEALSLASFTNGQHAYYHDVIRQALTEAGYAVEIKEALFSEPAEAEQAFRKGRLPVHWFQQTSLRTEAWIRVPVDLYRPHKPFEKGSKPSLGHTSSFSNLGLGQQRLAAGSLPGMGGHHGEETRSGLLGQALRGAQAQDATNNAFPRLKSTLGESLLPNHMGQGDAQIFHFYVMPDQKDLAKNLQKGLEKLKSQNWFMLAPNPRLMAPPYGDEKPLFVR